MKSGSKYGANIKKQVFMPVTLSGYIPFGLALSPFERFFLLNKPKFASSCLRLIFCRSPTPDQKQSVLGTDLSHYYRTVGAR